MLGFQNHVACFAGNMKTESAKLSCMVAPNIPKYIQILEVNWLNNRVKPPICPLVATAYNGLEQLCAGSFYVSPKLSAAAV